MYYCTAVGKPRFQNGARLDVFRFRTPIAEIYFLEDYIGTF